MNIYDVSEISYKNGYEAGVKEFAEKLKRSATAQNKTKDEKYVYKIDTDFIDNLAKELTESK